MGFHNNQQKMWLLMILKIMLDFDDFEDNAGF